MNDVIYMLGGYYKTKNARKFRVSTGVWESLYDNSMYYTARVGESKISFNKNNFPHLKDCAATIIHNIGNKRRRMFVHGSWSKSTNCMWMDPEESWSYCTSAIYYFEDVHSVTVSKHEHYLLGGQSNQHGAASTR